MNKEALLELKQISATNLLKKPEIQLSDCQNPKNIKETISIPTHCLLGLYFQLA